MKAWSNTWKLIAAILVCEGTGLLSGWIGSAYKNEWFDQLRKPSWNPPGYIFGPVWTTLYLLMGISLWLVWKDTKENRMRRSALIFFGLQLLLNFCWSIIFFRLQSPGWAFLDIVLLFCFILVTIFQFASISKTAAWLLVPYISWVSFAACLNFVIWKMN
jgi:translocator protein